MNSSITSLDPHLYKPDPYAIAEIWENFFVRHPTLEVLRLPQNMNLQLMKLAFENLANLKRLKVCDTVVICEEQQAELIGLLQTNLGRLDMYKLNFRFLNNQQVLEIFQKSFPGSKLTIEAEYGFRAGKLVLQSKNFDDKKFTAYFGDFQINFE
jgi:hypothetical protein